MSIPLDRLYNFLQDVCNRDIIIYRWMPHGSRKLEDLQPLQVFDFDNENPQLLVTRQPLICHDQEPLNYDYWSTTDFENFTVQTHNETIEVAQELAPWHLRAALGRRHRSHVFGQTLLCHSELNSKELAKYESNGFSGVYYWSHALIARDWFRYAQIDPALQRKSVCSDFLIYNRAWSGTREYRLKFAELLIQHKLTGNCKMTFNPIDNCHYQQHQFQNPAFTVATAIEQFFDQNHTLATASADYNSYDYNSTHMEIVLETIFDDDRLHLTEKILRPIACGQPFILAASAGSLALLRRYGFKTFDSVFDESYDSIADPVQRLTSIVRLMSNLASDAHKEILYAQCREIADFNQRHFFSSQFHDMVVNEFKHNFITAYTRSRKECSADKMEQYRAAIMKSGDYARTVPDDRNFVMSRRQYVYDFISKTRGEA